MAVVKISGKQFVIKEGQTVEVPFVDMRVGQSFHTEDMLTGDKINMEVVGQKRTKKVIVVRFKNKSRSLKVASQRNKMTVIKQTLKKAEVAKEKSKAEKEPVAEKVKKAKPVAKKTTKEGK